MYGHRPWCGEERHRDEICSVTDLGVEKRDIEMKSVLSQTLVWMKENIAMKSVLSQTLVWMKENIAMKSVRSRHCCGW